MTGLKSVMDLLFTHSKTGSALTRHYRLHYFGLFICAKFLFSFYGFKRTKVHEQSFI